MAERPTRFEHTRWLGDKRSQVVYDVESFIAPRARMLSDGSLAGFREWPEEGAFAVYGDIAHWWGAYAKEGRHNGVSSAGRGQKSIQFVRVDGSWRISAVAWDDER